MYVSQMISSKVPLPFLAQSEMIANKIRTINLGRIITSYEGWELQAGKVGVEYLIDVIQPIDQMDDV